MLKCFLLSMLVLMTLMATGQPSVQLLSPSDFGKKLSLVKDKQLIDVRTIDEFNKGHINNAMMIDYLKDDFKSRLLKLDKTKPVFVYCASGARSSASASILSELGFNQVYDLKGGFRAWSAASKPTTK